MGVGCKATFALFAGVVQLQIQDKRQGPFPSFDIEQYIPQRLNGYVVTLRNMWWARERPTPPAMGNNTHHLHVYLVAFLRDVGLVHTMWEPVVSLVGTVYY